MVSYLSCTTTAKLAGSLAVPQAAHSAASMIAKAIRLARAAMRPPWSGIGWAGRGSRRRAELDRRAARQERLAAGIAGIRGTERSVRQRLLRRLLVLRLELFVRLIVLRHRERAGIVPAGKAHQRVDARADRRVRSEQVGEALARIVDAHFHHGGGRGVQLAAILDLAQRRDHRIGIL